MHREKNKALKNAGGAVQRKTTTTVPKPSKRRDRSRSARRAARRMRPHMCPHLQRAATQRRPRGSAQGQAGQAGQAGQEERLRGLAALLRVLRRRRVVLANRPGACARRQENGVQVPRRHRHQGREDHGHDRAGPPAPRDP
eukprot:549469-Prymnesium_polylepis.1